MVRIVHTVEELLIWRRRLKLATPIALYYYSFSIFNFSFQYSCPSLPKNYKLVVLFYCEPNHYLERNTPSILDYLKRSFFEEKKNSLCSAVFFVPSENEMKRLSSTLGALYISKSMYPLHFTAYSKLNWPAYIAPALAMFFILRPRLTKWESNSRGLWFTGINLLNYIGASQRHTWQNPPKYSNQKQLYEAWTDICQRFRQIEANKITCYNYIRWATIVPVTFFGGCVRYVGDAQLDCGNVPNIPPDPLLFSGLQHVQTLTALQCRHIFNFVRRVNYIPYEHVGSIIAWRLWGFPHIEVVGCTKVTRHCNALLKGKPKTTSIMFTCKLHGLYLVNVFVQKKYFNGFKTSFMFIPSHSWHMRKIVYSTQYYLT